MDNLYGKFRGQCVDNADPMQQGRIKVIVPEVSESELGWAMPCVPVAERDDGDVDVPEVGASVWVEFEHGDPEHPIWVGVM